MKRELKINQLEFTFKKNPVSAFSKLSFEMGMSECWAALGPNGSGKSTLFKVLAGVLSQGDGHLKGEFQFFDRDFFKLSQREQSKEICYVGADLRTDFALTVGEVLNMGLYSHDVTEQPSESVIENLFLSALLRREIGTLSGGERQRVLLARALIQNPQFLILDETLSKMDLDHQSRVGAYLKKWAQQKSVMIVSHDLNFILSWADHLMVMNQGSLLQAGPMKEIATPETLARLYPDASLRWTQDARTGRYQAGFEF